MAIKEDVQKLEPGSWVELYELDATAIGGEVYRFHPYSLDGDIVWQGMVFGPWPVQATGFEMTGQGAQPQPQVSLGNVGGFITSLCLFFQDLIGTKFIRRRTLGKYLDGQPTADPTQELPPETWIVERKTSENNSVVSFELSSPLDFEGVQLPRRQVVANTCSWLSIGGYRGPYCNYVGPPVADKNDVITTDAAKDMCSGSVKGCKFRFGEEGELNYGSFPAAGLIR